MMIFHGMVAVVTVVLTVCFRFVNAASIYIIACMYEEFYHKLLCLCFAYTLYASAAMRYANARSIQAIMDIDPALTKRESILV